jgi:hypothetical protein
MSDPFAGESHFRTREAATAPKKDAAPPAATKPASAPAANTPPATTPAKPSSGFDVGQFHFGLNDQGTPGVSYPAPGGSFFSLTGPGWGVGSQTAHDVQDRLTNNALYNAADPITSAVGGGDLATLRAQRQAMDARMPVAAKATADIGAQFMPQNILLNRFGGPALQGAVQQGAGSFNQGNDLATAGKDAVIGAGTGKVAQLAGGALNPQNVGWAAGKAIENIPAAVGLKFGGFGGGWAADKFSKGIVEPAARRAEEFVGNYMPDWPAARNFVQNAVVGSGQTALDTDAGGTARQTMRDYLSPGSDWGAAGTALQNLRGMLPF